MSDQIFTSVESQRQLAQWHERFLARVKAPIEHHEVTTSSSSNHVLLAGEPNNPPLVVLHGALSGAAHALSELAPLLSSFHLILPDIPGQSALAPQKRLEVRTDAHDSGRPRPATGQSLWHQLGRLHLTANRIPRP